MTGPGRKAHWENVYATKSDSEVSWFQTEPVTSLNLIRRCSAAADGIIDVGAGASRLADALLDAGYRDITALDISAEALAHAQARLGERASKIEWIAASIVEWQPRRSYGVWHDRAVFHFLTEAADRAAYVHAMTAALAPGGCAIISTFAPDGPERCSGLPVVRYSGETLAAELGGKFRLEQSLNEAHRTPWGSEQRFQFSRFERI